MKNQLNRILELITKDKKRTVIIGCSALIIMIAMIVVLVLFLGRSKEKELNQYLEEMGASFYEELYYEQVGKNDEERANFLKDFSDIGLKISLDGLSRYKTEENQEKLDAFINPKTKEPCDSNNTKVVIYPQAPYGKKDYRLEKILVCGFEEWSIHSFFNKVNPLKSKR